jgi:oligopeptide/dipeptide ABC transporter ATP-binding protein
VALLDRVHIDRAAERAHDYPHMLSGGMCQRVMIAIALSCEPKLLIADEPTTALDVTVQARVLDLLREVQRDTGVAILFISHDLGVIAEIAESVSVMYAGHVVEQAPVEQLFVRPGHPYTEGLLGAIPKRGQARRYVAIPGNVPMAGQAPTGCPFHPRCRYAVVGRCDTELPALVEVRAGQNVRCVRVEELELQGVLVQ